MTFLPRHRLHTALLAASVCLSSGPAVHGERPAPPFPRPPAWVADQTLYEVNLRHFSAEGTVEGLRRQLPRLKALGVGTVWLMPVQPIGKTARTGKLGSPYAPADYKSFNPEFGTIEQFKRAVDEAHRLGLYVIIDWVAVHTAPDHPWVTQHPAWYKRDDKGQLIHPQPTWRDVVALNYDSADLRREMIDVMAFWVRECGVDGFRVDTAEFVPLDFWVTARDALRRIKPVFLLAEGNDPALMNYAFDAAYAWYLPENTQGIAAGTKTAADLADFIKAEAGVVPGDGFRLNFTTNHDKNAWEGTTREQLKGGVDAFTVLTFTLPGMPLIFNGQEAGIERRLNFFDRDPIQWRDDPAAGLYRTLAGLKRDNRALWAGVGPAPVRVIDASTAGPVLTFRREAAGGDAVVVMLNLGDRPADAVVPDTAGLRPVLGDAPPAAAGTRTTLKPWAYRVWSTER